MLAIDDQEVDLEVHYDALALQQEEVCSCNCTRELSRETCIRLFLADDNVLMRFSAVFLHSAKIALVQNLVN